MLVWLLLSSTLVFWSCHKGKTKDGLYLGSINCRDVSTNDDRSMGNEKKEVYGKEEVTRQQKRKETAATSVRELHKFQEIARPSDTKLFYADVKK